MCYQLAFSCSHSLQATGKQQKGRANAASGNSDAAGVRCKALAMLRHLEEPAQRLQPSVQKLLEVSQIFDGGTRSLLRSGRCFYESRAGICSRSDKFNRHVAANHKTRLHWDCKRGTQVLCPADSALQPYCKAHVIAMLLLCVYKQVAYA